MSQVLQTANNLEEVTENVDYYVQGSTVAAGNLFERSLPYLAQPLYAYALEFDFILFTFLASLSISVIQIDNWKHEFYVFLIITADFFLII